MTTSAVNPQYTARLMARHDASRTRILGIEVGVLLRPETGQGRGRRPRTPRELDAWRPSQMRFRHAWLDAGQPDQWFELLYTDLYLRVRRFAKGYFEFDDIPTTPGAASPWRYGFSAVLIYYVSLVAAQDKNRGGWDALLLSRPSRTSLVTGAVAKALDIGVFQQLLFGASEVQQEMLASQDAATLDRDGYERTDLRSRSIISCLGDDMLPPGFWQAVDRLATQLVVLLLPLLNLMDSQFPDSRGNDLQAVHQDLHHIVAEAGYLSIGIRRSKAVFRFPPVEPGQQWDMDQDNADAAAYGASKLAATAAAGDRLPDLIAKVHIVEWPALERWAPIGGPADGETIYTIMRGQVVYYAGVVGDAADKEEAAPSLRRYVDAALATRWRWRRRAGGGGIAGLCLAFALVLLLGTAMLVGDRGGSRGLARAAAVRMGDLAATSRGCFRAAYKAVVVWFETSGTVGMLRAACAGE